MAACIHGSQVTGAQHQLLSGSQIHLFAVTVDFHKDEAIAGKTLHDETFTAEKCGAQLLLEENGLFHIAIGCQVTALLDNKISARFDFNGQDLADKVTGKCDHALSVSDILVDESMFA